MKFQIVSLLIIFSMSINAFAQREKVYKKLEEALKNPNQVYQLDLSVYAPYDKEGTFSELAFFNEMEAEPLSLDIIEARVDSMAKEYEKDIIRLSDFPKEIAQFKNLEFLRIDFHNFTSIPDFIYDLEELNRLDIRGAQISSISKDIEKLSKLKRLDLSNNKITELPKEISTLKYLERLNISDNPIRSLNFLNSNLINLKRLDAFECNIADITPLCQIKTIEHLDLDANKITVIPALFFRNMRQIKRLMLGHNKLTAFSSDVVLLNELEYLNLSHNKIKVIPTLFQLTKLEELHLSENLIKEIPQHFYKLNVKMVIYIYENPIPDSVLKELEKYFPKISIYEEGC